jgi:hypothetical protein
MRTSHAHKRDRALPVWVTITLKLFLFSTVGMIMIVTADAVDTAVSTWTNIPNNGVRRETWYGSALTELYFHGPAMHGYGFWGGRDLLSMCAERIPQVDPVLFQRHPKQCIVVLQRDVEAFILGTIWLSIAAVFTTISCGLGCGIIVRIVRGPTQKK